MNLVSIVVLWRDCMGARAYHRIQIAQPRLAALAWSLSPDLEITQVSEDDP